MFDLIIFILVSYAITSIVTKEYIFYWFRKRFPVKPFTCPNCFSVWVGIILSFLFPVLISPWISWLIYGCVSYTTTRLINGYLFNKEIFIDD